jgi:hypothetical protein
VTWEKKILENLLFSPLEPHEENPTSIAHPKKIFIQLIYNIQG